ncbi:unnamed protein product [Acidithrix sp. C25]|nr:unnamed protein product [Acidithrix sp. C25]
MNLCFVVPSRQFGEVGIDSEGCGQRVVKMRHIYSGKVRDIYELDGIDRDSLLMVASDRVSAYDVIMNEQVANKGTILTAMSAYWMKLVEDIVPNHLVELFPTKQTFDDDSFEKFIGRGVIVAKAQMIEVECIVRGYLAGSAAREYFRSGTVHGRSLKDGLVMAERLDEPIFCPSIKNHSGHDENISIERAKEIFGSELISTLAEVSIEIYNRGARVAEESSIYLADTKFEFGFIDGELALCDEILTPDSSRFWEASTYEAGKEPMQYDKQPLRDYLDTLDWDKTPPPPSLDEEVLQSLSDRYAMVYERIAGQPIENWITDAKNAYFGTNGNIFA